jgi:hypothetical protein
MYSGLIAYSFTDWYLIGAAVQGGWDNADTNHQPMFRNGTAANKYFYGYFGAGNFKLISTKGSYSQLGKASATAIEVNGNAGEYNCYCWILQVHFDTTTLTYTLAPYTGSTATTYTMVL